MIQPARWLAFVFVGAYCCTSQAAEPIPPIERVLPPKGIEVPAKEREDLAAALKAASDRAVDIAMHPLAADVTIYMKAVDFALRHGEFYGDKDVSKAHDLLKQAEGRIDELKNRKHTWTDKSGLVVRGFNSAIDGSPQPYGLEIPDKLDATKPAPLYVWLHGRGDKQTDLHFIHERQSRSGQIAPAGAIVLHAFGRHCLGFKSAGEIDVLEAVEHAKANYKIDPRRIVLMGFSMGGAGAWHLGAHYADRWVAVSPGAGFAETARYQNLKPENYPAPYVQTLWGLYDVPDYVRNLFNLPVVAYSGELDKQKQAADVMAEAFASHGQKLLHVLGPGVEHKYEPNALRAVLAHLDIAVRAGREEVPQKVRLQTRTLRYNKLAWVEVLGLDEHWKDSRVDAEIVGKEKVKVTTTNVSLLRLMPFVEMGGTVFEIDGQGIEIPSPRRPLPAVTFVKSDKKWTLELPPKQVGLYRKIPGLQGPIDDAFIEPFLVVVPTGKSKHEAVQRWVEFELDHFLNRWRAVFRGEPRVKKDIDVTPEDIAAYHLIAWGNLESNKLLGDALRPVIDINQEFDRLMIGHASLPAKSHVPVLIHPNPLNPAKYLVVNSGPTFREAHDKTNSQQNPKLPDWAIIDLSQFPDANSPGKIAAAGFFDENWKVK